MSKHDPEIALRQMLTHAREAVAITQGKTRPDLDQDRLLNLALARLVEIIAGEVNHRATSGLTQATRGLSHPGSWGSPGPCPASESLKFHDSGFP